MERLRTPEFDEKQLRKSAMNVVRKVEANSVFPKIPKNIDAVIVLGGPGTFFRPIKGAEPEWASWMDRDRIRDAVRWWQEISNINGRPYPLFVYNGSPEECKDFKMAQEQGFIRVETDSILVQENYTKKNPTTRKLELLPHTNTRDNLETIMQSLANPDTHGENKRLYGKKNILLDSHQGHYIRIPNYLEKLRSTYRIKGLRFFPVGVSERPEAKGLFRENELNKLVNYAKEGFLATQPTKLTYFWEVSN